MVVLSFCRELLRDYIPCSTLGLHILRSLGPGATCAISDFMGVSSTTNCPLRYMAREGGKRSGAQMRLAALFPRR